MRMVFVHKNQVFTLRPVFPGKTPGAMNYSPLIVNHGISSARKTDVSGSAKGFAKCIIRCDRLDVHGDRFMSRENDIANDWTEESSVNVNYEFDSFMCAFFLFLVPMERWE